MIDRALARGKGFRLNWLIIFAFILLTLIILIFGFNNTLDSAIIYAFSQTSVQIEFFLALGMILFGLFMVMRIFRRREPQ